MSDFYLDVLISLSETFRIIVESVLYAVVFKCENDSYCTYVTKISLYHIVKIAVVF